MGHQREESGTRRWFAITALVLMALGSTPAAADPATTINWPLFRSPSLGPTQAIGGYAHGCLAGGIALPLEGTGYQVMRPSRRRYFGHPALIDYLQGLGRRTATAGLGLLAIGDLAQPRGGPMNSGHASHQIGLDVDIWLRLDLPPLPRDRRDHLTEVSLVDRATVRVAQPGWTPAHTALIKLAARDPRVTRIFVNPAIKLELCRDTGANRDWLSVIRPWYGHDDHIHVRLACPADSPLCEPQAPLPPGDGCGSEVASWLSEARPPDPHKPHIAHPPPNPTLPVACSHVIVAATPATASIR